MHKYKTIEEFMSALDDNKRSQVEVLRELIISSESNLEEHIKWNAPSYVLNGEDRITFNLLNKENIVKLVFHMGALRKEDKKGEPVIKGDSGLVEWSSDIRGVMSFANLEEIKAKSDVVRKFIIKWLSIS